MLQPCLSLFAAEADRRPSERQHLLQQMFETAELVQDGITSREIDEAAARLAANARDPKVAQAIRRRQDAADNLAELYRERDALAEHPLPEACRQLWRAIPRLWTRTSPPHRPNWRTRMLRCKRLRRITASSVQQVVPAADVLAELAPDEALAAITLTKDAG